MAPLFCPRYNIYRFSACVGRTLLSTAVEVGFGFELCGFRVKSKSGGQECPPDTCGRGKAFLGVSAMSPIRATEKTRFNNRLNQLNQFSQFLSQIAAVVVAGNHDFEEIFWRHR